MIIVLFMAFAVFVLYALLGIVKAVEWGIARNKEARRREAERKYYALPKILGGDGN